MFFWYFSICGFTYAAVESRFFHPMCCFNAHGSFSNICCAYIVACTPRSQWGNMFVVTLIIRCILYRLSGWFQFRDPSVLAVGNSMFVSCGIWFSHVSKICVNGANAPFLVW